MKRCPQCNSVFDDNLLYCTHAGTPLARENFTIPSEFAPTENDEETIIRREPIRVNVSEPEIPIDQPEYQIPAAAANVEPIVIVKRRNTGKYILFLLLGLILGGGLVLATLLLSQNYYRKNNSNVAVNSAPNTNVREVKTPTPTPTPAPTPNAEHLTKTSVDDEDFNGRVIVSNANIRSAASKTAASITLLPMDDRLNIERRANEESPWYYVTCEHGTSGWMHGDTIEFTQNAF
jgi:hypothetical protein